MTQLHRAVTAFIFVTQASIFCFAEEALNLKLVDNSTSIHSFSLGEKVLKFPQGIKVNPSGQYSVFGLGVFFSYGQQLTERQVTDIDLGFTSGTYCILVPRNYARDNIPANSSFKILSAESKVISVIGRSFDGTALHLEGAPYSQLIIKGDFVASAIASCFGGTRAQLFAEILTVEEQLQKIVPHFPEPKPYDFSEDGLTRIVEKDKSNYQFCIDPNAQVLPPAFDYQKDCYMTYASAESFCKSQGMRLPTLEEVMSSEKAALPGGAGSNSAIKTCDFATYPEDNIYLTIKNGETTKKICYQAWGNDYVNGSFDNVWTSSDLMSYSESYWSRSLNKRVYVGLRGEDFKEAPPGQKAVWDKFYLRPISHPASESERLQVRCAPVQ